MQHLVARQFEAALTPPHVRPHPRQQLGEGKRLDEIIVSPELKAFDPIGHAVAGREEQDRRPHLCAAQGLQDLPSVDIGQHDVQDEQVVLARHRQMQPVRAIARQIHDEAVLGQSLLQVLTGFCFVFDDQKFHTADRV